MSGFDIARFNNLIRQYYDFKCNHPYDVNTWRANSANAHSCRVILEGLAREIEQLIGEYNLIDGGYSVQISNGAGLYPKNPSIGVFYGGDKPTNGVYPVLGFLNGESGFFIACVCSFTNDKEGFPAAFTDLSRCSNLVQREQVVQSGVLRDRHTAMPAMIFPRENVCAVKQIVDAFKQAVQVKREYAVWRERMSATGVKSSNPIVQKALKGASLAELSEALGYDPNENEVGVYEALPAKLRKQYLESLRVVRDTVRNKLKGVALDEALESAEITKSLNAWIAEVSGKQQSIQSQQDEVRVLLESLQEELGRAKEKVGKIDQISLDCTSASASVMQVKGEIVADRDVIREAAVRLKSEYEGIEKSLSKAKEIGVRAADDIKDSIQAKLNDYLDRIREDVDGVKKKLHMVLSGVTTDALSKEYARKRTLEFWAIVGHTTVFVFILMLMLSLASAPIWFCYHLGYDLKTSIEILPKLYVFCLPFYVPLLWLAFLANRRMNLAKQLKERYAHKLICGRMYTGLAGEIKDVSKSGYTGAKDLLSKFLESTIRVYERDPAEALTKGPKTDMPVVEVLNEASKAMHAAAEVALAAKGRNG